MSGKTLSAYLELGKFRLSLLVLFTATIGYVLSVGKLDGVIFLLFALATLLCSMGANGLNQCWEYKRDAQMARTKNRPLPTGRISLTAGLLATSSWLVLGIVLFYTLFNPITALLAGLTAAIYLIIYTPLKTHSSIAVLVGAVPGAIPPLMGWSAATGQIEIQAWVIGCLMYLWQIPHFMSLAAIYQKDYARGGYKLLPDNPELDQVTRSIIVVFCIALLAISLLAPLVGLGEIIYLFGAVIAGGTFLYLAVVFYFNYSLRNARRIFLASIFYLPFIMGLLVIDQRFPLLQI